MKVLTLSYDDGIEQDIRFISLLKKYGLQCTFNLNSGLFGVHNHIAYEGLLTSHFRIAENYVKTVYDGFEIACHSLTHPRLDIASDEEVIREMTKDEENLNRVFGCQVSGMAYPGGNFYTEDTIKLIVENTNIRYARTVTNTEAFALPERPMEWNPTCYHLADNLFELTDEFISLPAEEDALFYVWGHAYEFDFFDGAWERIEKFMQMVSGKEDIVYATNQGALDLFEIK